MIRWLTFLLAACLLAGCSSGAPPHPSPTHQSPVYQPSVSATGDAGSAAPRAKGPKWSARAGQVRGGAVARLQLSRPPERPGRGGGARGRDGGPRRAPRRRLARARCDRRRPREGLQGRGGRRSTTTSSGPTSGRGTPACGRGPRRACGGWKRGRGEALMPRWLAHLLAGSAVFVAALVGCPKAAARSRKPDRPDGSAEGGGAGVRRGLAISSSGARLERTAG